MIIDDIAATVKNRAVWISPDEKFYNGDSHERCAEEILNVLYYEDDIDYPGDRLQELGWIKATTSLMWELRIRDGYWDNCKLTQKQLDSLYDWCKEHNKIFPY